MVNLIWVALLLIGLVFAGINGTMKDVNEAMFQGAKEAVTISIGLISVLVFWLGLMKIAEQSGLLSFFAHLFRPIAKKNFPGSAVRPSGSWVYIIKYGRKHVRSWKCGDAARH
ncbi:Spore maturation protein A [Anoxybacillus sp. BCO1]|nr:Spore maturation protein A [Anoxybacillus sp. BCO1]